MCNRSILLYIVVQSMLLNIVVQFILSNTIVQSIYCCIRGFINFESSRLV